MQSAGARFPEFAGLRKITRVIPNGYLIAEIMTVHHRSLLAIMLRPFFTGVNNGGISQWPKIRSGMKRYTTSLVSTLPWTTCCITRKPITRI
ncbi:hypothetical protein CKO_03246 [Citrobacter koseri ATCC BAA-895]|uniref:Uncharacterized protein n=1 Tax=Citrobacter koseri (strain ATCC BAA-895 / CDC 4225-83 / SGSC4696) TaxID=290338 RepID=A8ALG7_CITK8|nr:hypothetical protein CKO_03246 [Citrobacter koseri ATCC BAA-895]